MTLGKDYQLFRDPPYGHLLQVMTLSKVAWDANFDPSEIFENDPECLYALQGEEVIGHVFWYWDEFHGVYVIPEIVVSPLCRKSRVGHTLLTAALESMRKDVPSAEVTLIVGTQWEPAVALYQLLGFSISNTIINYYGPGQDVYAMKKSFKVPTHQRGRRE